MGPRTIAARNTARKKRTATSRQSVSGVRETVTVAAPTLASGVAKSQPSALVSADDIRTLPEIGRLRELELPFLVLTNNSIYTRRDLAARLRRVGLDVPEETIWTSALLRRAARR